MNSKIYLDEKVRQAHYQDLLREAEKRVAAGTIAQASPEQKQVCCRENWPAAPKAWHPVETVRAVTHRA